MLLLKANSIALEHKQLEKIRRGAPSDPRQGVIRLVNLARASSMETDLTDRSSWETQYIEGLTGEH